MDPAPRMAVDCIGERVGRLLVIDGESYQSSASCLWNYRCMLAWDPHRANFPLPLISIFLAFLLLGTCKYSLPVTFLSSLSSSYFQSHYFLYDTVILLPPYLSLTSQSALAHFVELCNVILANPR